MKQLMAVMIAIFVVGCASQRQKTEAAPDGLAEARQKVAALKLSLRDRAPEQLIRAFILDDGVQRKFGGYDYYYSYMANDAVRDELESRGESARAALISHRGDTAYVQEAVNGAGDTIGSICEKLLRKLPNRVAGGD